MQEIDIHEPKRNLRSAGFTEVTVLGNHVRQWRLRMSVKATWLRSAVPLHVLKPKGALGVPVVRQEERQSFTEQYTDAGFRDAFREQHPGVVGYTYFSHRFGMRAKGKGWRLDYYLVIVLSRHTNGLLASKHFAAHSLRRSV
jgi:hypothetical protein